VVGVMEYGRREMGNGIGGCGWDKMAEGVGNYERRNEEMGKGGCEGMGSEDAENGKED
jgi:hypothetical protein